MKLAYRSIIASVDVASAREELVGNVRDVALFPARGVGVGAGDWAGMRIVRSTKMRKLVFRIVFAT